MVRIDGHRGIVQEYAQRRSPIADVRQRLRQQVARQQAQLLELLVDPVEEALDEWFAVRQPMQPLGFADEFAFSDLLLDLVDRCDLPDTNSRSII